MSTLSILPIRQQRWGCINLCSDSKDLCGTIQHKFTSDTGKSERAGLYQTSAEGGGLAACGHIGQIWRCLKALTKGRWCALPASGHWHDDQTVATTSGNSLLHCLGEKPTQNIFLGKKYPKLHTNIYVMMQGRPSAHLAYKRLQAPKQLSIWVYNKVKPLKKTMSSWSKSKGENKVWEGRKTNFALSPEKGWLRELVCSMCVACIENRN